MSFSHEALEDFADYCSYALVREDLLTAQAVEFIIDKDPELEDILVSWGMDTEGKEAFLDSLAVYLEGSEVPLNCEDHGNFGVDFANALMKWLKANPEFHKSAKKEDSND